MALLPSFERLYYLSGMARKRNDMHSHIKKTKLLFASKGFICVTLKVEVVNWLVHVLLVIEALRF